MVGIQKQLAELYAMEGLAAGNTFVHGLHPSAKIISTTVYLFCVVSLDRYALTTLLPFIFYPVLFGAIARVPFRFFIKRTLVALPFCLLAGLANLFFDTTVWRAFGSLSITYGGLSFFVLLLRVLFCVAAVLLLVATTPLAELCASLRRMGMPKIFITLLEMTYRYSGVLIKEASAMYTAYLLRGCKMRGVRMEHMGSFSGQLLLRSFDRAERVYQAMLCRGYGRVYCGRYAKPLGCKDYLFLLFSCGSCFALRFTSWLY